MNPDRTTSQNARDNIDLALSLESNKKTVSLLTSRSDKLSNNVSGVNNRSTNICVLNETLLTLTIPVRFSKITLTKVSCI